MGSRPVVLFFLIVLLAVTSESYSAEIEWKLYLKNHPESILSKSTVEGEEFIFHGSDCVRIPSESYEIVNALEGTSFLIQQSPVTHPLSIHITMNVFDNTFLQVKGIKVFMNISFEAYVDGVKQEDMTFSSNSPMIMKIPKGTGLDYLLSSCSFTWQNYLLFVYNSDGMLDNIGITTTKTSSGIKVEMNKISPIIGGIGSELGFPASVSIDTWKKIKLFFK